MQNFLRVRTLVYKVHIMLTPTENPTSCQIMPNYTKQFGLRDSVEQSTSALHQSTRLQKLYYFNVNSQNFTVFTKIIFIHNIFENFKTFKKNSAHNFSQSLAPGRLDHGLENASGSRQVLWLWILRSR